MDTAELLKKAWEAVVKSGVPTEVQGIALRAAVDDLRAGDPAPPSTKAPSSPAAQSKRSSGKPSSAPKTAGGASAILDNVGDAGDFFARVSHETGVSEEDLRDVFHVEKGHLELKVASKDLGDSNKASTMTVTALLGGAIFAGTDYERLPIKEVHDVCKSKRCHARSNAATWVKATPHYATIGSGKTVDVTEKSGWQGEFARSVAKVLGKAEDQS